MGSLHVNIMWLLHLTLLALYADCHGAILPMTRTTEEITIMDTLQDFLTNQFPSMKLIHDRVKRQLETEDETGFIVFPFPSLGTSFKIKFDDPTDYSKGGEAFIDIEDLHSHISTVHSNMVKIHIKFDNQRSLFTAEVDYQLEHMDGTGIEAGSLRIIMEDRGDKVHYNIKTETQPFTGIPIIPAKVSNVELDFALNINSERRGWFAETHVGSIQANSTNEGVITSTMEGTFNVTMAFFIIPIDMDIKIDVDHLGIKYNGLVKTNFFDGPRNRRPQQKKIMKVDITKGAESILKFLTEFTIIGRETLRCHITYTFKQHSGIILGEVNLHKLEIKFGTYKFVFQYLMPYEHAIKTFVMKGEKEMWSYKIGLTYQRTTSDKLITVVQSDLTLDPESMLYGFIQNHHPFGAFLTRTMTLKITRNYRTRNDRNAFFRGTKIEYKITKDGVIVLDMVADTRASPYNFNLRANNLFRMMNIHEDAITLTVDYMRGSHIIIDTNIGGGVHMEARQADNSLGGKAIDMRMSEADVEMFTYHADTSKVDTDSILKFGFKGDMMINPESILYRTVFTKYPFFTPFRTRSSDLEFMVDRVHRNNFLNKFHIKSKVDMDGVNALNLEISTNHKPYKLYFFYPTLFEMMRPGMTEVNVTMDHVMGQHLYLDVHHTGATWKGFKISTPGNGNIADIEWNGRNWGSGEYTLTDNSFTTVQNLDTGESLSVNVTWKNKWDTVDFLLDNAISVKLDTDTDTENWLILSMVWAMDAVPDMDFTTPKTGLLKMFVDGCISGIGEGTMEREVTWTTGIGNVTLEADIVGSAMFDSPDILQELSPINTHHHFTYDIPTQDLDGYFKEEVGGKEYSIDFPEGSFVIPNIKIGGYNVITMVDTEWYT